MSNPHMRRLLDVSTAHLSLETREILATWKTGYAPIAGFAQHAYGWFFWVPTDDAFYDLDDQVYRAGVPDDIVAVLTYARAQGAEYVVCDADGPVHEGLAVYEEVG